MEQQKKNKRLKLGIVFNFDPSWMGGIVYILNLIKALDFLDDEEKPEIVLFYRDDLKKFIDEISYPYLTSVVWKFPPVFKGYILSWFSMKNRFISEILKHYNLDGLYPLHDYPLKIKTRTKLVSWYADLQHKYYPEFFTRRKIIERNARIRFMLKNSTDLVVSSQSVADDFKNFYRLREGMKMHVFHFSSVVDDQGDNTIETLLKKYQLPVRYFMVSNQFHKHKNHKVLLQALVKLKELGLNIHLAITGKFPSASYSLYMQELHSIINDHNLQSKISMLGVIPRNEQLVLMKHSQAVLQPSLFEGWSTVIEDAKSLQVPVIASDLPVNREQMGSDGVFFNPFNPEELATILLNFPARNLSDVFYDDYNQRIKETAENFIRIFC